MYQEDSLKNYAPESMGSGEGTGTLVRHDTPSQHKKSNQRFFKNKG